MIVAGEARRGLNVEHGDNISKHIQRQQQNCPEQRRATAGVMMADASPGWWLAMAAELHTTFRCSQI